jgi:hypothetical protein
MRALMKAAAIVACFVVSPVLSAQWPPHPSTNVPKTPDGKPDLSAPAPRTADGKPDFSGVWRGFPGRGRGAAPEDPPPGTPVVATFRNVGAGFKDGLPLRPWAAELLKKRMDDNSKDNPEAVCLPMGIVQLHTQGFPRKFIQTPTLFVILYEASSELRQIFIDGRSLPNDEAQPWWYGYSVGKWEGDTLVVTTTHFRDGGWLDINGSPLTDEATITERFRRPNYGRMEIDVTVDDPKAYTKPWTVRVNQQLMVDGELMEFICLENNQFRPK